VRGQAGGELVADRLDVREPAAEDDHVGVEHVEDRGERSGEAVVEARHRRQRLRIARVRESDDGGGVSNVQRLYRNVTGRWHRYVFSDTVRTRLLPPVHGDSSGVRGAAWLGRDLAPG